MKTRIRLTESQLFSLINNVVRRIIVEGKPQKATEEKRNDRLRDIRKKAILWALFWEDPKGFYGTYEGRMMAFPLIFKDKRTEKVINSVFAIDSVMIESETEEGWNLCLNGQVLLPNRNKYNADLCLYNLSFFIDDVIVDNVAINLKDFDWGKEPFILDTASAKRYVCKNYMDKIRENISFLSA